LRQGRRHEAVEVLVTTTYSKAGAMMSFPSRHFQRDIQLPQARDEMLENAVSSLESDENIEGIFLGGSLAEGNTDLYSDIDLRIVVPEALLNSYIEKKHEITRTFGNVLFLIGKACFVK